MAQPKAEVKLQPEDCSCCKSLSKDLLFWSNSFYRRKLISHPRTVSKEDDVICALLFLCVLGAKLDDFADFTTFGIATSLLLRTPNILDNVLCMCYMLCVFIRLCFFSSGEET